MDKPATLKENIQFYIRRIREGRLREMLEQTRWIYSYARHYKLHMLFYTLLGLSGSVVSLISSLLSRDLVDIITGQSAGELIKTFVCMITMTIGTTVLNQLSSFASNYISMRVDAEIKSDVFAKILETDWESLSSYHTGDLLTRWGSDASNISNGVLNFIPNAIIYLFQFISALGMVLYYDASFAIFAFISIPVSLIMSRTLMRRMVNNNQRSAAMNARMSGFNQETFSNIQTIKAFHLIRLYVERLKQLQHEYITMRLDFQKMSLGTSLLLSVVGLIASYACYGWGIYRVWSGAISYGTMTLFLSLSGTLTGTLNSLTSLIPTAISLTTSAGRIMDIVEMPREDYSQDAQVSDFLERTRAQGLTLRLSDISYTYHTGTEVFAHASLEAGPHEIIALVGPSGEGKTTMLRLILSLMRTQDGTATLSGMQGDTPLSIPLSASSRLAFSYVPQGNTMFSGTIAENMRNVCPNATDEQIVHALQLSCAWEFVSRLPDGIYSKIGERGSGFSEGQSQRLSIARALLHDAPVLLLDEATSALDVATERRVLKNIMNDERPHTCLVTTHRPTVLSMCSRVYAIREKQCVCLDADEIRQLLDEF